MKNFKFTQLISAFAILFIFPACDVDQNNPSNSTQKGPSGQARKNSTKDKNLESKALGLSELQKLGFHIPAHQEIAEFLPPQPGSWVQGQKVKGAKGKDTNWTAFTLVLFLNKNGGYEVLTQKRAIRPVGAIECPGGHLTGGQTWLEGAKAELHQEAGIKVQSQSMFYLEGGQQRISQSGKLYGNVNMFVVFKGSKPKTSSHSKEVDSNYGHRWIPLEDLYNEVKAEELAHPGFGAGKYYHFFRKHLIHFVERVMP